ncbi:MAG: rod shape-determining protein MreC [Actinobacteria bacterium]|nr:rod shape-determining protein MreC [Actinomycetota bacterium]NBO47315.1 rod shape-determining protein MreC [Actinomycetota bacterium]NBP22352.1 rod shape-determining protein MreC [Actinomycetota bacterium]NDG68970.1 rod shape-determining protein MreC [Actinomycetota bacterium]
MANRGSNRSRLLWVSLLVTSLFIITLDLRGVSLLTSLRSGTQSVIAPFERLATRAFSPVEDFFSELSNLGRSRAKIEKLEEENQELKNQVIFNEETLAQLESLKGVLDLAGKARYKTVSARVISRGGTGTFSETIVLDIGSDSGVRRDMTVVAASGLVGVVKSTTSSSSIVLLMNDPSFRIGVRVAGKQDMGILLGQGDDNYSLQMLSATSAISVGDVLLARGSSGDKPFVPGVPVGSISYVENTVGQLTREGKVNGFVDLNSLSVVSVVLAAVAGDPGDALVPTAPRPAPTATVFVTPSPTPKE